jgi:D-aminoacyl-tRNA deacylase
MSVVLISSTTDAASINIKNNLLQQSCWEEVSEFCQHPVYQCTQPPFMYLITINDNKIFHEHIDKEIQNTLDIQPTMAIFLSRHRSKSMISSLSVHPIGNYGEAKFGGKNKTLVYAHPHFMTGMLRSIKKNAPSYLKEYQICFEVTHHGPYLEIPTVFVEIGSTEKKWNDPNLGQIIACSVLEVLQKTNKDDCIAVVGVGGGHYAPRFSDVAFEKKVAFGHMIPKYQIDQGTIDIHSYKDALKKTPHAKGVYIHKKSFKKSEVTQLVKLFKKHNIDVFSSNDFSDV